MASKGRGQGSGGQPGFAGRAWLRRSPSHRAFAHLPHGRAAGEAEREVQLGPCIVRAAVDLGVTLFDTADLYDHRTNEELVGESLRTVRSSVVIATKVGTSGARTAPFGPGESPRSDRTGSGGTRPSRAAKPPREPPAGRPEDGPGSPPRWSRTVFLTAGPRRRSWTRARARESESWCEEQWQAVCSPESLQQRTSS